MTPEKYISKTSLQFFTPMLHLAMIGKNKFDNLHQNVYIETFFSWQTESLIISCRNYPLSPWNGSK